MRGHHFLKPRGWLAPSKASSSAPWDLGELLAESWSSPQFPQEALPSLAPWSPGLGSARFRGLVRHLPAAGTAAPGLLPVGEQALPSPGDLRGQLPGRRGSSARPSAGPGRAGSGEQRGCALTRRRRPRDGARSLRAGRARPARRRCENVPGTGGGRGAGRRAGPAPGQRRRRPGVRGGEPARTGCVRARSPRRARRRAAVWKPPRPGWPRGGAPGCGPRGRWACRPGCRASARAARCGRASRPLFPPL